MARFIDSAAADGPWTAGADGRAAHSALVAQNPCLRKQRRIMGASGRTARMQVGIGFLSIPSRSESAPRRLIIQTGPAWHLALANREPLAGGWLTASGGAQCFHFGLDGFSRAEDGTRRSGPLAAPSAVNAYESPRALLRALCPRWVPPPTPNLPYGSKPRTASTRPPPFLSTSQPSRPVAVAAFPITTIILAPTGLSKY